MGLLYGPKTNNDSDLPFQMSTDSDDPDCVFQLDTITIGLWTIEESHPSDSSPCCDYACDLSCIKMCTSLKICSYHFYLFHIHLIEVLSAD